MGQAGRSRTRRRQVLALAAALALGLGLAACGDDDADTSSDTTAESGDGVVLRLYEASGTASRLAVAPTAGLELVGDCNLLEDPAEPRAWRQPFAIRSVRLRTAETATAS